MPILNKLLRKLYLSILIFLFLVDLSLSYSQQTGQLAGQISSQSSGESLVGVNVMVVGTSFGAATDIDGKYVIRKIPAGTCSVRISGLGYAAKTITEVVISTDAVATLDVSLNEETYNMKEVVITADEVRSAENTVLSQRKRAASISDGVSAEQIKRSPDATSGDALKRVTGLSIVDNKFVFVRGITDRYNETTLDGAPVTSTEVGKKGFSFDLLPANLIENTSVVKTPTPDLPGDFSGGLVQLNTQDFPAENSLKLNFGTSYNSVSSGKDFFRSQGGSRDWLGSDDGTRSYSGDLPDGNQIARQLPNSWAPRTRTAPYNSSLSLSLGEKIDLSEDNSSRTQLGFIGAATYKNSYQRNEKTNDDFELSRNSTGTKDEFNVLWGVIANLSVKFDGLHKISFKNSFNQSGNDAVTRAHINDQNGPFENIYTAIQWTQRSTYTGQLVGEHSLPLLGGLTIQWRGAVSSSRREDPDGKEAVFYRDPSDPSQPFYPAVNKREWAKLNERSRSFGFDATLPLFSAKLKTGGFTERKVTDYKIRYFNVSPSQYPHPISDSLAYLPLETIYSPENFGTGKFLFTESTHPDDSYDGEQSLYAAYGMFDLPVEVFSNAFRFVGGARLENSEQSVFVPKSGGTVTATQHKNVDLLPSLNVTYIINNITNLRVAYSQSVNRPEFRELASTGFFDYVKYELVAGNPNLQRSYIHNYDARFEIYPSAGELFAVSYFRKHISNAIEEQLIPSSTRERTWFNSPNATNSGWEFEARKSLNFLGGYLGNFSISGNFTKVQSEVEVTELYTGVVAGTRPLQGQSPYVINLSLLFTEPTLRTSITVLYNKFGSRLDAVGFQASDIYEEPRDLIDIAIAQPIIGNLEAKFTIKNLGNKDRVLTREGHPYEQTTSGRTFGLQMSAGL